MIDRTINRSIVRPIVATYEWSYDKSRQSWHQTTDCTIKRSIVRPIVRSIVRLPSRDHPQLVVPPCMTGGTSPAYILATMPVYDPTELSPSNLVATVQRSLPRRNQYTVTTRTRPSDYLKAATLCLLSVIYIRTIKRSIVRPIVRSIVRLPSRDHPQLVVPPCMTGGTSPAYILATMPVYDPTELSPSNRVATVQRSLPRRNQYTVTARTRPSDYLKAATLCLLSVIYMHHGAIWCLDTHQELQRLWLADTLRLANADSPGEPAEMWADWDEMQSLVTRDLVSSRADRKSGRNR